MAYRMNPVEDVRTLPHRGQGHGPKRESEHEEDSTLLMDATMKAICRRSRCRRRSIWSAPKKIWERLGLPALRPEAPWFGYSLGDWLPQWDAAARRAASGQYLENGRISESSGARD
jgi:4-hydroxy-3-polyprenylbenzoate decarboxylase